MKRIIYCFLVALLCVCGFSACGKDATNSDSSSTSEVKESNLAFVQNEIVLSVGQSVQAELETSKKNIYIFWSTRDEEIATVSDSGVITALAEGQTICYAEFAGEMVMCLIKVTAEQAKPLLSVSVPYANDGVTLYVGDSLAIKATVKLGDLVIDNAQIEYEIDKADIVRVEDGKVFGDKAGTATITIRVSYEDQNAVTALSVNVVEK